MQWKKKLQERKIKYEREKIIPTSFAGEKTGRNKIDFIIENKIIIEAKCKRFINREDFYQTKRYLEAFNKKLGILVNFRETYLKPKRVINSKYKQ